MKTFDNFIWYEKYRPTTIKNLILSQEYRIKFQSYIEEQEIPHLLLFGPNGSGKTTMATILMDSIKCQRLVLNASGEDRGIDTIKGKVKQFASSQPFTKDTLKIIFLDEADKITPDAQDSLRNTIEMYSKTCRFILTGNYVDKFKKSIKSRCTMYEFSQYPIKKLMEYLDQILKEEKVKAQTEEIEKLVTSFYPDIRSIVNNLQACSVDGKFDLGLISSSIVDQTKIGRNILEGKVKSLRTLWVGMNNYIFVYKYLFDEFIFKIDENKRPEVAETIAEFMYRDTTITDREINVTMCCLMIMRIIGSKIQFNS